MIFKTYSHRSRYTIYSTNGMNDVTTRHSFLTGVVPYSSPIPKTSYLPYVSSHPPPPSPSFLFTLTLPLYIGYPKLHPFSTPLIIHPFHPLYSYPFHKTHYTPFIEPPPYTTPSDCISFEKYKNSKNIQVDFDHNYTNRTF